MYIKKLLFVLALLVYPVIASAQVSISPTYVILDDEQRFGSFLVLNNSDRPQEVSVNFTFGYFDADSSGAMAMVYDDSTAMDQYSINDLLRAFPRTFTVNPQQRQLVRITIRPDQDLEDGTYWTRIKTVSSPQALPVGSNTNDGVSATINFQLEQVTSLLYKKGNVNTGINITSYDATVEGDLLTVKTVLDRTGNSPYLGNVTLRVYDSNNDLVLQDISNISVYFDYISRFSADISSLRPGTYRAEVQFATERTDIPSADLIKVPSVTRSTNFEIE